LPWGQDLLENSSSQFQGKQFDSVYVKIAHRNFQRSDDLFLIERECFSWFEISRKLVPELDSVPFSQQITDMKIFSAEKHTNCFYRQLGSNPQEQVWDVFPTHIERWFSAFKKIVIFLQDQLHRRHEKIKTLLALKKNTRRQHQDCLEFLILEYQIVVLFTHHRD
jgi:hypothetical protein